MKKNITHILKRIAAQHHTTVEEVRREMNVAIRAGINHPDPAVRAQWVKIPRKGEIPTPEDLIAYTVQQVSKENASKNSR